MPKTTVTYDFVHRLALAIEKKYKAHNINIHADSELGVTLNSAKKITNLHNIYRTNKTVGKELENLMPRALCCMRLGENLVFLDDDPKTKQLLKDLADGSMMYWNNDQSKAKNTEYEVSMWARFNEGAVIIAKLIEPDVQIYLDKYYGVACKRLYSFGNSDNQISDGVSQLSKHGIKGFLSLSIDSLIQPDVDVALLNVENIQRASDSLQDSLHQFFLLKKDRIIKRYFSKNRLLGVIITAEAFARIKSEREDYFHVREMLVWDNNMNMKRLGLHETLLKTQIHREAIEEKLSGLEV